MEEAQKLSVYSRMRVAISAIICPMKLYISHAIQPSLFMKITSKFICCRRRFILNRMRNVVFVRSGFGKKCVSKGLGFLILTSLMDLSANDNK